MDMSQALVVFLIQFIFNTEARVVENTSLKKAQMPESCADKTFCFEKSIAYPQQTIDDILVKMDNELVEGSNEIGDRFGFEKPENECDKEINFDPIYEILDLNENVRFVVQSDTKFLQKIRTETCVKPGPIDVHNSKFFEPYQLKEWDVSCVEKRIEYWFTVLSLDGSELENVQVKAGLPVCCSCQLKPLSK